MDDSKYAKTVRMYFSNVALVNLFFDNFQQFGDLIFAEGDTKLQRLADLYEKTRKMFQETSATLTQFNKQVPEDVNTEVKIDGFMVKYMKYDKEQGLVTVLIGLPKPTQKEESWGLLVKYNSKGTNRLFSLDFDGYKNSPNNAGPNFLVCEFVSKGQKKELTRFETLDDAITYINNL